MNTDIKASEQKHLLVFLTAQEIKAIQMLIWDMPDSDRWSELFVSECMVIEDSIMKQLRGTYP